MLFYHQPEMYIVLIYISELIYAPFVSQCRLCSAIYFDFRTCYLFPLINLQVIFPVAVTSNKQHA